MADATPTPTPYDAVRAGRHVHDFYDPTLGEWRRDVGFAQYTTPALEALKRDEPDDFIALVRKHGFAAVPVHPWETRPMLELRAEMRAAVPTCTTNAAGGLERRPAFDVNHKHATEAALKGFHKAYQTVLAAKSAREVNFGLDCSEDPGQARYDHLEEVQRWIGEMDVRLPELLVTDGQPKLENNVRLWVSPVVTFVEGVDWGINNPKHFTQRMTDLVAKGAPLGKDELRLLEWWDKHNAPHYDYDSGASEWRLASAARAGRTARANGPRRPIPGEVPEAEAQAAPAAPAAPAPGPPPGLPQPPTTAALRKGIFGTRRELVAAADLYLRDRKECKRLYGDIRKWTFPKVKSLKDLFRRSDRNNAYHVDFDPDLSKWDVAHVTDLASAFRGCHSFRGRGLEAWKVQRVQTAKAAFADCSALEADLSGWEPVALTTAPRMFEGCFRFDADLSAWRPRLVDASAMFKGCTSFQGKQLGGWDMSGARHLQDMFRDCARFESDLSGWSVARVQTMDRIFQGAAAFDSNLSTWRPPGGRARGAISSRMFNAFVGAKAFTWDLSARLVGGLSARDHAAYHQYCRSSGRTPTHVAAEARIAPKWQRLVDELQERKRAQAKVALAEEEAERSLRSEETKEYYLSERAPKAWTRPYGSGPRLGGSGWATSQEEHARLLKRTAPRAARAPHAERKRRRRVREDGEELPEDEDEEDEEDAAARAREEEELGIAAGEPEEIDESMDMDAVDDAE